MQKIKCNYCDKRADAKVGDTPEYLCAECWLKFYKEKSHEKGFRVS